MHSPVAHHYMGMKTENLDLPKKPGVYLFYGKDGRTLYVGKATNLESRVRSYFSKNPDREMIPKLIKEAEKIDFIVTQNPSEALILERQLIRKHKPKYNSQLKDDKSYPFIALTSDDLPRIMYTRTPQENWKFWGPFPNAGDAKRVIKLIRRYFGIRDKRGNLPFGFIEDNGYGDYSKRIETVCRILNGNAGELIIELQNEMDKFSERLDFENAARTRDMIVTLQNTISQNIVSSRFYQDCDAVGFSSQGDRGCVVILHTKDGIIQAKESYPLIHKGDIVDSISLILSEHYGNCLPPKIILVPCPLGLEMNEWLTKRRKSKVEVRIPKRGNFSKLRIMADRNAEIQLNSKLWKNSGNLEAVAANDGASLIGIENLKHVVCFDMAQLMGNVRVGASIVFRDGRPSKKEYRTYRVKSEALDDISMMKEIVSRWIKNQNEWPDLILLDGGIAHLSIINKLIRDLGFEGKFKVAALAKREERLYTENENEYTLDRKGRIFIYARDEAHRFVNSFHSKRRNKIALGDPLEVIEGLGAKKIQSLLRYFGGKQGIMSANEEELVKVPGIGKNMARKITEFFKR